MVKSSDEKLDEIFQALSHSIRRSILREVARREKTVNQIAEPHNHISLAAISKHLKVLEGAGLIERKKMGSQWLIRLNPKTLKASNHWISYFEQFWTEQLDVLQNIFSDTTSAE